MVREIICPEDNITRLARNLHLPNLSELIAISIFEQRVERELEELIYFSDISQDNLDFLSKVTYKGLGGYKTIRDLRKTAYHNLRAHILGNTDGYKVPKTLYGLFGECCLVCFMSYKDWIRDSAQDIFSGGRYETSIDEKIIRCSSLQCAMKVFDEAHLSLLDEGNHRVKKPR